MRKTKNVRTLPQAAWSQPAPEAQGDHGRVVVIAAVMAALFVSATSQTVIGTARPRIIGEPGGLNFYSWVLTSSMLGTTAVIPLVGKPSDTDGRKPLFMGGIGLFTSVFAVASVAAPLSGGFLTDHLRWRWVSYFSLPFGLVALVVFIKGMPWHRASGPAKPIDWFGMTVLLWAVIPLLLALAGRATGSRGARGKSARCSRSVYWAHWPFSPSNCEPSYASATAGPRW